MAGDSPAEALSDAELARQVAAGPAGESALAEAELCRRLGPRIRLYGLRHLRNASAADDLVQEVLLLTLERLRGGRVREPERIASFVLGASRLVARGQRRGQWRRRAILERHPGAFASTVGLDTLRLDEDRLRDCLGRLGERERSVIVLTFYAERPSAEIACELGTSPENVRTVRHRAFARLRDCVRGADS